MPAAGDRQDPGSGNRGRGRPRRGVRHCNLFGGREVRAGRGQAGDSSGGDLAVHDRQNRPDARAGAVPYRRAIRRRARAAHRAGASHRRRPRRRGRRRRRPAQDLRTRGCARVQEADRPRRQPRIDRCHPVHDRGDRQPPRVQRRARRDECVSEEREGSLDEGMTSITKIIVPNRGEIAVRIARTCREMGITSILAYSEADDIHFVRRFCDDAISLGAGDARDTYLHVGRVIDAARQSGADALHPGYGFLAERAELAAACADAGIIFVGPKAASIAAMGSKSEARHLMRKHGVPVVPGYDGEDQSDATLAREAKRIGFPVLIKASSGGGGKGMKIVRSAAELQSQIESARRESAKAFGNDRLLLERYIEKPRHVEFQILGDAQGNVIHLFERDCSIQRRYQKVIEESPAPRYTDKLRQKMAKAAIAAALGVDYQNAGTVEFIVAPDGEFYFLEMNTRLQVEHPVTEQVLGVDLVRAQIEIASGAPLPWKQTDLRQRGHAIEVRVYAEDPDDRFLPQSGTIGFYDEPRGAGVRVDAGVGEGSEISVNFDPMLAKLICYAESRDNCIDRLERALRDYTILGTKTNLGFLRRVVTHPAFREGKVSTRFLLDHDLRNEIPELMPLIAAALTSSPARHPQPATRHPGSVWDVIRLTSPYRLGRAHATGDSAQD